MKRWIILGILFGLPAALAAQLPTDELVIMGAGWVGNWDTEIVLSDSGLAGGTHGSVFKNTILPSGPCPPFCESASIAFELAENASHPILASEFLTAGFQGPQTIFVSASTEAPLPIVRARVFNRLHPEQSAELPVIGRSTLQALDPSVLSFPGAIRSAGSYSNLILQTVGGVTEPSTGVLVELFGQSGERMGSAELTVPQELTSPALTLVDVVALLGVAQLELGQIRVTKTSGDGILWGVMSNVYADGSLAVVAGVNP